MVHRRVVFLCNHDAFIEFQSSKDFDKQRAFLESRKCLKCRKQTDLFEEVETWDTPSEKNSHFTTELSSTGMMQRMSDSRLESCQRASEWWRKRISCWFLKFQVIGHGRAASCNRPTYQPKFGYIWRRLIMIRNRSYNWRKAIFSWWPISQNGGNMNDLMKQIHIGSIMNHPEVEAVQKLKINYQQFVAMMGGNAEGRTLREQIVDRIMEAIPRVTATTFWIRNQDRLWTQMIFEAAEKSQTSGEPTGNHLWILNISKLKKCSIITLIEHF